MDTPVAHGSGDRSDERVTHRNGYRNRNLERRMGTMNLQTLKLRSGNSFPSFLEPRKTSEQARLDVVKALGMSGISKSRGSWICGEIDERVQAFLEREITGKRPYLQLD